MSTTITGRTGPAGVALAFLTDAIAALRIRHAAWTRRRAAYLQTWRELDSLSDRELNDIGFSRHDIARIAREAAARA